MHKILNEIFINKAEVVVCDGFVGNILLKFTEGLAAAASKYISEMTGKDSGEGDVSTESHIALETLTWSGSVYKA